MALKAIAAFTACAVLSATAAEQDIAKILEGAKGDVTLEKGVYRSLRTIVLEGKSGITIDGAGSTLLMGRHCAALEIIAAKGLTLKNFNIDYDPLPFTQGTVTEIAADGMSFSIAIHEGYPRLGKEYAINRAHLFDAKSKLWKDGANDLYGKMEILSPDSGRFVLNSPEPRLEKGDLVALNLRQGSCIELKGGSESVRLEDISILASPGLAICERYCEGGSYYRVAIKRGPKPQGATEERLLSSCADGINVAYSRKGPTIEGCDFSFMGDDSVNLHTVAMPIVRVDPDGSIFLARPYGREAFPKIVRKGDPVRFLASESYAIAGAAKIVSFDYAEEELDANAAKAIFPAQRESRKGSMYKLKIEDLNGEAKAGGYIDLPGIGASGYRIANSKFHDHRGRALRLMASNGKIEGNSFERIKNCAIYLGGEYSYWREAGWVEGIEVIGNTITDAGCGRSIAGAGSYAPGAIAISAQLERYGTGENWNSKILIKDNKIESCPVSGIFVYGARGVRIEGNSVKGVCRDKGAKPGSDFGYEAMKPINAVKGALAEESGNIVE